MLTKVNNKRHCLNQFRLKSCCTQQPGPSPPARIPALLVAPPTAPQGAMPQTVPGLDGCHHCSQDSTLDTTGGDSHGSRILPITSSFFHGAHSDPSGDLVHHFHQCHKSCTASLRASPWQHLPLPQPCQVQTWPVLSTFHCQKQSHRQQANA